MKLPKTFDTLKAWSYSTYTQYLQCPLSVGLEKVLRIRITETPNEAMLRGGQFHKSAEIYVKAPKQPKKLPPELKNIEDRVKDFRKKRAAAELEWAFDSKWNPVSWFAREAWLRMKIDVVAQTVKPPAVAIVDYKTGKVHMEHAQQRSIYGLGGLRLVQIGQLANGDKDTVVTAEHLYTDTGQTATEEFRLVQLAGLQKEWLARTKGMLSDTKFKPKVGYHCRWCKFRKSNGGPCPENQ